MTEPIKIGDATLYTGNCLQVMKELPDNSIHCCVTSPPYWGLRDYKTPGMIGLETTFQEYLDKMVEVCREVKRVLRPDGTFWLNCGDAYSNHKDCKSVADTLRKGGRSEFGVEIEKGKSHKRDSKLLKLQGFKNKDLLMMPARLAIALQEDGWWLRSEIIWAKPNPMPESVTDRPTSSHEKIYLLTKRSRYFYDAEAVRIPHARLWDANNGGSISTGRMVECGGAMGDMSTHPKGYPMPNPSGANLRNVWNIATQPYPEAHFATFPEELPRKCILAGTSDKGCCPECGAPYERVVEKHYKSEITTTGNEDGRYELGRSRNVVRMGDGTDNKTIGWQPTCKHDHEPIPCTVLDPFAGSGTTLQVALSLSRKAIGIELNSEYVKLAVKRISKEANQLKLAL